MSAPTPAEFVAAHPDIKSWSTVDYEVYEHLVEAAAAIPTEPLSPAGAAALAAVEAKLAALPARRRVPGPVAQVVAQLDRPLSSNRRFQTERHLEGLLAERSALGVAS